MEKDEQRAMKTIERFADSLPKLPDGRIDYTDSDTAPVVLVFVKCGDRFLLLKRGDKVGVYKGRWNVVGGYLDEPKPVREKALVEVREELGIEEGDITSVRLGKSYVTLDKQIGRMWIVYPVLVELNSEPEIRLDWEHTEYRWIKPEELGDFDTVPDLGKGLESVLSLMQP